ncbi:MAG TPA: homoserine kinase [Pelolinea sp.]|nr:homoserine kinase [Pelolinea sp.]
MDKNPSVKMRVPATTANLGPGFDCLGLALDLWNDVEISFTGSALQIEIEGEGQEVLPRDQQNLIFRSIKLLAEKYSREITNGILIRCANRIPVASGMGSSSSAVIAGLMAANKLLELRMSQNEILKAGLELEGHVDNIAACLLGGLVIVGLTLDSLVTRRMSIQQLKTTIALPDISLSTHQARNALPRNFKIHDIVFNISRTAMLIDSFSRGDFQFLKTAMEDRIHQPYRLELIPGAEEAMQAAIGAGADGVAISGAGPSIIAFHKDANNSIGRAMLRAFESQKTPARLFRLSTINTGAYFV